MTAVNRVPDARPHDASMSITWDASLATGHADIDDQHRELFSRIDQLLHAMKTGRGRAEVSSVVAFLDAYVLEHFGNEERLMKARRFPAIDAHLLEHRKFVAALATLRADLDRDGPGTLLVIRVNHHLLEWLRDHIHVRDRALAEWLATPDAPRA